MRISETIPLEFLQTWLILSSTTALPCKERKYKATAGIKKL